VERLQGGQTRFNESVLSWRPWHVTCVNRMVELSKYPGALEESSLTKTKCCMWPYDILTSNLFGVGYNAQVWALLRMLNIHVEVTFYVINTKSSG